MKIPFTFKRVAAAVCLGALVSACATSTVDLGTYVNVPEDRGRVLFTAAAYDGATPSRVGFADRLQRSEYTLYRTQDGQAEAAFLESREENSRYYVLEFDKLVAQTVRMWRFNQGHTLDFDESQPIKTDLATFWVQTYRQTDTGRQCVGFNGKWDIRWEDPSNRPTKILFGYHCLPAGRTLGADDAVTFVKSIDVRGVSIPLKVKTAYDLQKGDAPPPPKDQQVASLVQAQDGAGGGVAGLPDFPLWVTQVFRDYDKPCYGSNC